MIVYSDSLRVKARQSMVRQNVTNVQQGIEKMGVNMNVAEANPGSFQSLKGGEALDCITVEQALNETV